MHQLMLKIHGRLLRQQEDGFSLLELVVAVSIMLILAVVGFISYQGLTDNARQAAVDDAANQVLTAAVAADNIPDDDVNSAVSAYNSTSSEVRANITHADANSMTITATDRDGTLGIAQISGNYAHVDTTHFSGPGITYAWTADPHNSVSVKKQDGEIIAQNIHVSPQGEGILTYQLPDVNNYGGAYNRNIYMTGRNDGPTPNVNNYVRTEIVEPATGGSGGYTTSPGSQRTAVDASTGDYLAYSFYIRYQGSEEYIEYIPRLYFYDGTTLADEVTRMDYDKMQHQNGQWEKVTMVEKIPEGTTYTAFWHNFTGTWTENLGDTAPAGSTVDLAGIHIAIADSEDEALDQVSTYFDGDSV